MSADTTMQHLLVGMDRLIKENNPFTSECGEALAKMADAFARLDRAKNGVQI